jgi:hypothetical protein
MRRLNVLLRKFEEGRAVELLNGRAFPSREKALKVCGASNSTATEEVLPQGIGPPPPSR